jgi:pyruvate dehydrogenase E2 component (dihydrolipoamide acetyltransferase)
MAEIFRMTALSPTMEVGKLVSWRVQEGDSVQPQDVLAEVETDKATMELETFDPGVVLKILCPPGSDIPVGAPIAIIGNSKDEDITALLAEIESEAASATSATDDSSTSTATTTVEEDTRKKAGPAARKAATELGVDLQNLKGTGPRGRVLREDVENSIGGGIEGFSWRGTPIHPSIMEPFIQFVPNKDYPQRRGSGGTISTMTEQDSRIIPNSGMRKTIARRLKESYLDAPTFFLNAKFNCDQLVSFRSQLKSAGVKVSYNDILIKAVARALKDVPAVNASWGEEAITEHVQVDIGIAVALPEGLITPVLRNANTRGLADVATTTRALIEKAKNKKLTPEEYQNSTFTISNLGMMAIEHFTAIINPPNAGILAVGSLQQEPVVQNGVLAVGWRMKVTMTCDHRVIDGALGAEFLLAVRKYIENPALLAS